MKRLLLLLLVIGVGCTTAQAQTPFNTKDSVNINKINALALVHGDMWWDPQTGDAHCYLPSPSHTSINFTGAIWMSGYDGGGQLHTAAQTYRLRGNDYWPGPLNSSDTLTYATSHDWAKIWKVNRTDINNFNILPTHDSASTPDVIWTWPAKGNTHARGNAGAPLYLDPANTYAPFVDVNTDGIYDPLAGDYPDVPGDQALWWIFSDNGPSHSESNGKPLGVEMQTLAYAYNRGTPIDNVIYYKYRIINRSANTYTNFRVGLLDDVDLGYYLDDYIGFDSARRLGYAYNGPNDNGASGGHPTNPYNTRVPIAGVTLVVLPGDNAAAHAYVPAGSFIYSNNDASIHGNPSIDTEYNHYLRSSFRDGSHLTYGLPPYYPCNYAFPGDPLVSTEWSECAAGDLPGNRRFILSSNDFTLLPGAINEVVMALVTTDLDTGDVCSGRGIGQLQIVTDTAWNIFYNPLPPLPVAIHDLNTDGSISIYPNPAHDRLYIEHKANSNEPITVSVYNTLGQAMPTSMIQLDKITIDISALPAGVYHVVYRQGVLQKDATFVRD